MPLNEPYNCAEVLKQIIVSLPAFEIGYGTVLIFTSSVAEQLPILANTWYTVVDVGVAIGFTIPGLFIVPAGVH